ncbi:MAG: DUF262 domain-containing HNH endonuclease family protein [Helicobacteraceae bacterium]|nr:DUF262 domain-containing HNH endonuclease family protein [Helicobacteraceae bacterium]
MQFNSEKGYISALLQKGKFLIPGYQRTYAWDESKCEALWDDILSAFATNEEYFLGSIVAFLNDKKEYEIIDGQQRLTTFTLLFRAFYEHFKSEGNAEKIRFLEGFGKCIWKFDFDIGLDFAKHHLSSEVIIDSDKEVFGTLLSDNLDDKGLNKNSNYAKNYNFFYQKIAEYKGNNALNYEDLCKFILEKYLFVLFVECDTQESAMRIFDTLNSRGEQLTTADILKGHIYRNLEESSRKNFVEKWKGIEENAKKIDKDNKGLDFLFLQYMHIIRAMHKSDDTTSINALDFFTKTKDIKKSGKTITPIGGKDSWLKKSETIPFLELLSAFWANPYDYLEQRAACYFSVLGTFPNNTYKPFVSYLLWRVKDNLEAINDEFAKYLPFLIKAISIPLLNGESNNYKIVPIVYKLNIALVNGTLESAKTETLLSYDAYKSANYKNTSKYILALYAAIYDDFFTEAEFKKLEIEHVLPQSWQNANFDGWDVESHNEYLENIGNLMLLEKKLNIKCTNNFFAKKQEKYQESKLKEVQELGARDKQIWDKGDIETRNEKIYNTIKEYFEKI